MKAEYLKNKQEYLNYYDEVEVCCKSQDAYPKAAIGIRNREMADRADLIICAIERPGGGAYNAVCYAEKQGKEVLRLIE